MSRITVAAQAATVTRDLIRGLFSSTAFLHRSKSTCLQAHWTGTRWMSMGRSTAHQPALPFDVIGDRQGALSPSHAQCHCHCSFHRCRLWILTLSMPEIDLCVELEVTRMLYTSAPLHNAGACIILSILLTHRTDWANNGGAYQLLILVMMSHPPSENTWHSQIGIKIDSSLLPWSKSAYIDLITSISSCLSATDISCLEYVSVPLLHHFFLTYVVVTWRWQKNGQPLAVIQHNYIGYVLDNCSDTCLSSQRLTTLLKFHDLEYSMLARLKPKQWLSGDLILIGLWYGLFDLPILLVCWWWSVNGVWISCATMNRTSLPHLSSATFSSNVSSRWFFHSYFIAMFTLHFQGILVPST